MAEHLANAFLKPKQQAHLLIIEARFHDALADALLEGARLAINEAGATFEVVTVPGALEIPAVITFATDAASEGGTFYDGFVALGTVIRGDTYHFDIVANESSRALMDLSVQAGVCIGNGILTTENEEQAWTRARRSEGDKGGFAAKAALTMIAIRERFEVEA